MRRPKSQSIRRSKSVEGNSGGIRFSLCYIRYYAKLALIFLFASALRQLSSMNLTDFFSFSGFVYSLGAVLLLIGCTFLVCHTPKNILNVYDLYRLAVEVQTRLSKTNWSNCVEGSLSHHPPPLSDLGILAHRSQPPPPCHQCLLQHLYLLPKGNCTS